MCREADKLSPDEVSLVLHAFVKLDAPTHAPDVFYTDVHDMLSRSLRFLADFEDFTALGVLDDDALLYLRREIHRTWESTPRAFSARRVPEDRGEPHHLSISLWNPRAVVHLGVMYGRCCVDS